MNEWILTRVWQVDHKLVVAKTIEDAIALYTSGGINYVKREEVKRSQEWIDLYRSILRSS